MWTHFDDLDFADDLALLSHNQQQMQSKTTILTNISKSVGLRIHPGKSKVLKLNSGSSETITVGGKPLEEVAEFTYLGSKVDETGGTAADIKARIGKARIAFSALSKVWKDRNISTKTKIKVFKSNVKSVLLYESETWSLTKT